MIEISIGKKLNFIIDFYLKPVSTGPIQLSYIKCCIRKSVVYLYAKFYYIESWNLSQSGNLWTRKCTCKILPSIFLLSFFFSIFFPFLFYVHSHVQALIYHYSIITLCIQHTYSIRIFKSGAPLYSIHTNTHILYEFLGVELL